MERGTPRRSPPARRAGRVLGNLAGFARDALVAPLARRVSREWLAVQLERGLADAPRASWLGLESALPGPQPLPPLLEALRLASADPGVRGVFVRVGRAPIGWAKAATLARALSRVRASGKKLVVYAEHTGNAGAWLGGLADCFWMPPAGRLDLLGVSAGQVFLRRALDGLGVGPEVIAAGRYKSAGEMLERESMSPEAREALEAVVDDLYATLVEGLASGRAGDAERARAWIDAGPYLADEALEAGILDELVYADEIPARLAELAGPAARPARSRSDEPPEARPIAESTYRRLARPRFVWFPPSRGRPRIAVAPVLGLIRSTSARGVVSTLRRLEQLDTVRAVVLAVDSPGGDPLASDLIWHATRRLAERKPVVASLGDRAASGGYYVAMGAHELVAEEGTLTGSIGVVLAGLELEGLLGRMGVALESIDRGRHAGIYRVAHTRSDDERALLKRQVERLYARFTRNAAESRGLSLADLEAVAEGRVWTGRRAAKNKLVDRLGGYELALERAETLAGLEPGQGVPLYLSVGRPRFPRLGRVSPFDGSERQVSALQLWCPLRVELA